MPKRRTGFNPLAYLGVEAPQPPNIVAIDRAPTMNDFIQFNTGDLWINTSSLNTTPPTAPTNEDIWMLVSKDRNIANATWVNMGGGDVETLTGDVGGAVSPDANDNINLLGTANRITTTGNPGTNTITWDVGATVATTYTTDVGNAIPAANVLNILGGTGVDTSGAGNTVTVNVTNFVGLTAWTPVLSFAGGTTGITYSSQLGTYARIGNIVFVTYIMTLTSKGTDVGQAQVRGLPFNSLTTAELCHGVVRFFNTTFGDYVVTSWPAADNFFTFVDITSGGAGTTLDDTAFTNTSDIRGSFFYFV